MRIPHLVLVLPLLAVVGATQGSERPEIQEQPRLPGIEAEDYAWDHQADEIRALLEQEVDYEQGRYAYVYCQGCHRQDGSGRPDGTYPQLAGQHASVLIKQMLDIRRGSRENPTMYPFADEHILYYDDLPHIAAYLESLPIPPDNGRGPGEDLARGERLYQQDCKRCHGANGEGDAERFKPVLAGQHYGYLVRQTVEIRDLERRNANPDMVKVLRGYTDGEVRAVSDYISRLVMPERTGSHR